MKHSGKSGLIFMVILVLNIVTGQSFKYFSNFKFEKVVFGEESLIKDFVTLADDPKGNLPDN